MQLHLIRHGPTHTARMVGWTDLPADLSDGAALTRLSQTLPEDAPVISSDLIRATATADAIAGTRRRLPHDPALREMNFGQWEMMTHDQIDPALSRQFWEQPGDTAPPGGESWNALSARVLGAITRLTPLHDKTGLIVVAHFGVILALLQQALRVTPQEVFSHRIDNLSLTQVQLHPSPQAHRINHIP